MKSSLVARSLAATAAVMVCALVLAACGNSTKTAAPTTTATTAAGRGAALAAFRSCMSTHGISLPANYRPGAGFRRGAGSSTTTGTVPTTTLPPGVTEQQWTSALQQCASSLGAGRNANNPAVAAYRNCLNTYLMSNGGTTLPSTGGFGFGGFGGGANGGTTTTTPLMAAALAHCQALRPAFNRASTTTSPTS